MEENKKYLKPSADIIEFLSEDVILTSIIGTVGEDDPQEQNG